MFRKYFDQLLVKLHELERAFTGHHLEENHLEEFTPLENEILQRTERLRAVTAQEGQD